MDEDLQCKPKRTLAKRDLFGLPYGLEVDRAFAASLHTQVPSKDSLQEEPWNRPDFEKPDHRAESQAKGLMQNEMARDLAQTVHDKNQVLLTGVPVASVASTLEALPVPVHTSLVQDELPKIFQRRLLRK